MERPRQFLFVCFNKPFFHLFVFFSIEFIQMIIFFTCLFLVAFFLVIWKENPFIVNRRVVPVIITFAICGIDGGVCFHLWIASKPNRSQLRQVICRPLTVMFRKFCAIGANELCTDDCVCMCLSLVDDFFFAHFSRAVGFWPLFSPSELQILITHNWTMRTIISIFNEDDKRTQRPTTLTVWTKN